MATTPTALSKPTSEADPAPGKPGNPPSAEVIDEEPLHPQISFFQQPWVQNILPFATSLMLHLVIIIVGLTLFKVVPRIVQAVQQQIIIPDATIVNDAPVGGVQNPGLGGDPNRAAAQDKVEVKESDSFADKKTESLSQSLAGETVDNASNDNVIGLGSHASIHSGGTNGVGLGTGDGGGSLAPFGVPGGGGGLGPKSPFMGISGNGRKIVYLVDASGSMLGVFPRVKEELLKSIDHLQPIQGFNIIVFHEDEASTEVLSKNQLIMATPDNKIAAHKFTADQGARGGTDPIPAIQLAFKQKPDLIYVLTDGFDNVDSFQAIIDLFDKLNVGKSTKVNTIMLKSRDDPTLEDVLNKIATHNGGTFRVQDEKDF